MAVALHLWDKKGIRAWENWAIGSVFVNLFGGLILLMVSLGERTTSDSMVNRHPELTNMAVALPAIRKHSELEYAKLVQEIYDMNKAIDSAKENNHSPWFDWFINDKLPTLPKIEIPKE
jgi:hypothetical protein